MYSTIFERKLNSQEVFEVRKALRGLELTKELERILADKDIASRSTMFTAINPNKYDGGNPTHRLILHEAVLLTEKKGEVYDWREPEIAQA